MKCQVSQKCGSCRYIEKDYAWQLLEKQKKCQKLFQNDHLIVHPVEGMENPYAYRNKVIVAFNQQYQYGLYEESTHKIVPTNHCLLHDEETHKVLSAIQSLLKRYRVSIYDEKRKRGFLRHVLIRRAVMTNQTLVVLVVNEDVFKGSKNFCQELIKKCPSVKSVVLNINKRQTSVVLSKVEKVLYGKGFIVDELCGLTFKISAQSFYQINHSQCTKLYQKVIDLLNIEDNQVVMDTYCGIGTIGMSVAHIAKEVIGVELNHEAYKDALNNAKMNKIDNIHFYNQDATEFMKDMARLKKHVDCVIMDPPRSGSTQEFVQSIQILKPKTVVYVSCDPTTQQRDLQWFKQIGYKAKEVFLYDMFPHSDHIESIIQLTKNKGVFMFETTGLLDKKFIKFIKKYSLTSYKRILFQVGLILFALNACICIYIHDYVFFAVNLFMVVFLWGYRHYLIRKNIDIYLELMNNDDASVKITTRFLNDGIHVSSKDKEGVFKYDSVSSYLKKNDMYILYTKGSKTIFIFCDCLTQEVEEKLIRFLKRQKTKIKWK